MMPRSRYWAHVASIIGAAALLAGCGSQVPIGAPGAMPQAVGDASSSSFQVLHRFGQVYGGGVYPQSALLNVNGRLYGTTRETHQCHRDHCGYGTVFSISATGVKKTLYRFKGASDGAFPNSSLIDVDGTLYGTTLRGGGSGCTGDGCGTVFSITLSGSERVLYSFQGGSDGAVPASALIEVGATLYGTTLFGGGYGNCGGGTGTSGCGTVYNISPSGSESVLHAFKGMPDGAEPNTPVTDVNGTLYGVTPQGGINCGDRTTGFPDGCGIVYSLTTSGSETVLHQFKSQGDGSFPTGGLVDVHGTLYGTTGALLWNRGSVYELSTDGTVTTLYRFGALPDAALPDGGLVNVNGVLYGTSSGGGIACISTAVYGCGTVFKVTTTGKESVLYRFASKSQGIYPMAGLTYLKGELYGMTPYGGYAGGHCYIGCGVVFALTP